ncbi:hypothetical protein BDV96DRAFT_640152 [Lophiotrema nucula]|uniref:BTB domain-containing protein n=1 Tax=Lophiotrema nucula TaxID=690887 RepID=A0A6A5ZTC2_9PLEO|nr:hypothetical protein BDV96DRAFT_640152 [Lophiotrema nucula]
MASSEEIRVAAPLAGLTSGFIEVRVGDEASAQSFYVHQDLICASSEFFERALNGDWQEAEDKCVKLPDDEPKVFENYINWLYTGKIPIKCTTIPKGSRMSREVENEYTALCELFVFCEKLQDTKGKNASTKALYQGCLEERTGTLYFPLSPAINVVYNGTPCTSPLRALLRDGFVNRSAPHWFKDGDDYCKEFLYDVVVGMATDRAKPSIGLNLEGLSKYLEDESEKKEDTATGATGKGGGA